MWQDAFYFGKSDRRIIIILGVICVGIITFLVCKKGANDNLSTQNVMEKGKENEEKRSSIGKDSTYIEYFDPNTVDSATLVSFGLKPWQARNLVKYRKAGGIFRTPESIERLYGWSSEDVERLLPFIVIGEKFKQRNKKESSYKTNNEHNRNSSYLKADKKKFPPNNFNEPMVDPNTADTTLLRRIPGIGNKISEAIVQYRTKLGGFYSEKQLLEISIFSPELLQWFKVNNPKDVKTININAASFHVLNSHPYISYEQTKSILNYIRLYGEIKDIESLKAIRIFSNEELDRVKPYLIFSAD